MRGFSALTRARVAQRIVCAVDEEQRRARLLKTPAKGAVPPVD